MFLGNLREIELERVKEKLSSAVMETCLALTIFREEFNGSFVAMFTALTFVKVFHWLVQDRWAARANMCCFDSRSAPELACIRRQSADCLLRVGPCVC